MMKLTVEEIIIKYLKENKYDGLVYPGECGCLIEDLCPCGTDFLECVPGHKTICDSDCNCE